ETGTPVPTSSVGPHQFTVVATDQAGNETTKNVHYVVYAPNGSGTLTTPTTSVAAGLTGRTIVFTYSIAAGGIANGAIRLTVPNGWSPPSLRPGAAGYTTASDGSISISIRSEEHTSELQSRSDL